MKGIKIVSTGRCVPEKILTNDDLSKIVDTSDEWISARTGIKRRHICEDETHTYLTIQSAKQALDNAGISKEDIGAVVVATFTSDNYVPSTACLVQKELGLNEEVICFDICAACSGFIFGLEAVRGLLLQRENKYALLIGTEVISKRTNMEDRGTCILFGDGSGAAVIKLDEDRGYTSICCTRGDDEGIYCRTGEDTDKKVHMDGQAIYRFAVSTLPKLIKQTVKKGDIELKDIDLFICHQANARIIDSVAKVLKQPQEKFFMNIQEYGNTSAASVAIALSEANEQGLLKRGMKVLLTGFGGGLTWGAVIIDW